VSPSYPVGAAGYDIIPARAKRTQLIIQKVILRYLETLDSHKGKV